MGLTAEVFTETPVVDPLRVAAEALLDVAYGIREPKDMFKRD